MYGPASVARLSRWVRMEPSLSFSRGCVDRTEKFIRVISARNTTYVATKEITDVPRQAGVYPNVTLQHPPLRFVVDVGVLTSPRQAKPTIPTWDEKPGESVPSVALSQTF